MTVGRFLAVTILALGAFGAVPAMAQKSASIGGTGRIQPAGGVMTLVNPGARQVVDRVLVKEGDKVKKGDILVVFAERALREAERDSVASRLSVLDEQFQARERVLALERESAANLLSAAKADAQALEGLDERTVASRERRARTQSAASAEIALRLSDARLAEARKTLANDKRQLRVQLDQARTQVAQTQLLAPSDGTVIEVMARPGLVLNGATAMTLADTSAMYVNADVFEGDLARIKPGMQAKVSNSALGNPVPGRVERISRLVDAGSRLAKVSIRLDQPAPADHYIGMQVDVSIDTAAPVK